MTIQTAIRKLRSTEKYLSADCEILASSYNHGNAAAVRPLYEVREAISIVRRLRGNLQIDDCPAPTVHTAVAERHANGESWSQALANENID